MEGLVGLRRDWDELLQDLEFTQRNHYFTAMELFKEMEAQGLTEVSYDGVTLRLTEYGEVWLNDPLKWFNSDEDEDGDGND